MSKRDLPDTSAELSGRAAPGEPAAARPGAIGRVKRGAALVALALFLLALALNASCDRGAGGSPNNASRGASEEISRHGPAQLQRIAASETATRDYSKFTHANPEHARLPCLLCHRRPDNSARPQLPGHQPCAGCHGQQFAGLAGTGDAADASTMQGAAGAGGGAAPRGAAHVSGTESPLCAICHTREGSAEVRQFPALKSFGVEFDHALHATGASRPANNCSACHKPTRGGVALSIPAGLGAHTTCFQCHSPRAKSGERDISSCDTCHSPGSHRRTQQTARAFAVGFSHAAHSRGLSCADCHTIRPGAAQGRQVSSPLPLMHHASARAKSCMSCHDDRRAFGGEDFGDCRRCHTGASWGR
jgi:c(7)-type cytochrome triheme protein